MTPQSVLVFAAGFGTRMAPLTQDRPKPLIRVAGKALLDHALDVTAAYGPLRSVVNAHYRADQIIQHLATRPVTVSVETPDILDTGGGLRQARAFLGAGPVFTLNSDMVWRGENPLSILAQAWNPADMDALLLCLPASQAQGRHGPGDFTLDDAGRLHRGGAMVYLGAQIVKPDLVERVADRVFSLNQLWDICAQNGRLSGVIYPGLWCDVGRPDGIAQAEAMLQDV